MRLEPESGGKSALAIADVASGWRRLKNTFGFCEESRLAMVRTITTYSKRAPFYNAISSTIHRAEENHRKNAGR
jgi:hypothetical protein